MQTIYRRTPEQCCVAAFMLIAWPSGGSRLAVSSASGPRTLAQLETFLEILETPLDPDVRDACDRLVPPGSAVANFHNTADWMKTTAL
jgi:hypothetical protein